MRLSCARPPLARRDSSRVGVRAAPSMRGGRGPSILGLRDDREQPVPSAPPRSSGRSWKRWLAYTSIVVAVVIVGGWIGAAFVPRWWSQRVADQVEEHLVGELARGVLRLRLHLPPAARDRVGDPEAALLEGLARVRRAGDRARPPEPVRARDRPRGGNAAHAGERTLDVEAPGFRNGTAVRAVLAVLAFGVLWWLLRSRRNAPGRADAGRGARALEPVPASLTAPDNPSTTPG